MNESLIFVGPFPLLNDGNTMKAFATVTSYHPQEAMIPPHKTAAIMIYVSTLSRKGNQVLSKSDFKK